MLKYLVVLGAFLINVSAVQAQQCSHYALSDRSAVKQLFSADVGEYSYSGVQGILSRMNEIAYLGTFEFLRFPTQRQAFEMEYQALVRFIDELGTNPPVRVRPLSARFVRRVVNTQYLGIAGTTITGATAEEAQANAKAAQAAIGVALTKLWACF